MVRRDLVRRNDVLVLQLEGEDVVYRPTGGTARTVRALVDREESIPNEQGQIQLEDLATLTLRTADAPQVRAGDEFELVPRVGKPKRWMRLYNVLSRSEDLVRVEVI